MNHKDTKGPLIITSQASGVKEIRANGRSLCLGVLGVLVVR